MTSAASSSNGAMPWPAAIRPARWDGPGCFDDLRVIEVGDEKGEFCGKLLAGDGAEVIKVEPPGGGPSRRIGPFYADQPGPERSLFFWHYNLGKRSVVLDLEAEAGRRQFAALVQTAGVLLDATPRGYLDRLNLGYARWKTEKPDLVVAAITPFGQTGPWKDFVASDLVHLALGGQMYLCGYHPVEWGKDYDTPPIAPQMWHAYAISNEHAWVAIAAALLHRQRTGRGQFIDVSIHDACAQCTEGSVAGWIYNQQVYYRQTGSHAGAAPRPVGSQNRAGDGNYLNGVPVGGSLDYPKLLALFRSAGFSDDLVGVDENEIDAGAIAAIHYAMQKYIAQTSAGEAFIALQACGLVCAPVHAPEANLTDPHCLAREDFALVEHPELGRRFVYPRHPRLSEETPWKCGPRAPLLGEHSEAILGGLNPKTPVEAF